MAIKLLIVDDHPMVREGLSAMLGSYDNINISDCCSNCEEALAAALTVEPDVILMDIKMAGTSGIETTRQILAQKPGIKVIFLTVFEDTESIRLALQSGAAGYILKNVSRQTLIETIERVYNGETIIDQSVFHQIVKDYTRLSRKLTDTKPLSDANQVELTPREQEILRHLVRGMTNKEIAVATNLAVDTVKTHLRNIFRKLAVKNRTQAISQAIKMNRGPGSGMFLVENQPTSNN